MRQGPEVRACGVCGRLLEHKRGKGWLHIYNPDDHVVVPVLPTEINVTYVCDFCFAPNPQWDLPARDFTDPITNARSMGEGWACCGECARLIERGDWGQLHKRVRVSYIRRHGRMTENQWQYMQRLYALLRKNITGPVKPAVWPTKED